MGTRIFRQTGMCCSKATKKRNPVFYGRMDLPSRVGWSGHFFFFNIFFLSGCKNDSPKNTKIFQKI